MLCNSSQESFLKGADMSATGWGPRAGYEKRDPDRLKSYLKVQNFD